MSRHHFVRKEEEISNTFMNVNGGSNPPIAQPNRSNPPMAQPKKPREFPTAGYNPSRENKFTLGSIIRLPATIAYKIAGPRPIVDGSSSSINKRKAYMQRVRFLIYGMYGLSLYGVYYLGTKFKKD